MCEKTRPKGAILDTLELTSELLLTKRAIRKVIAHAQAKKLQELNTPLFKQYEQTRWCAYAMKEKGGKYVSNYCQKRWCPVCSANRQGAMLNGYQEAVSGMKEPYFVTLTLPAVKGEHLKGTMKEMLRVFVLIKDTLRKKGIALHGIRKLECNFNPKKQTFNPHFHMLVEGELEAKALLHYWLKRHPEAVSEAQDIQPAQEGTLKELVKYTTKTLIGKKFYPEAQDTIYRALKGIRTFQPYGNIRKAQETPQEAPRPPETADTATPDTNPAPEGNNALQEAPQVTACYYWNNFQNTWVSPEGVPLVKVELSENMERLIENIRKAPLYTFYLLE